jgi:hypothetical protein
VRLPILSRSRFVGSVFLALGLFAGGGGAAQAKPLIEGLESRVVDDRLLVSFNVTDGMQEETLERIHSGIAVSFKHRVDIVRKRWMSLWPAKDMARTRVVTEATYDSLTRQYSLLRRLEVKSKRKRDAVEPEEERRTTDSLEEMQQWMTQLRDIPVYDPSRTFALKGLRLRVESSLGRRFVLLLFPSTIDAYAERRLDP